MRVTNGLEEIDNVVESLSGISAILRRANPADKAEVYRQLGIRLTYKPALRLIQAGLGEQRQLRSAETAARSGEQTQ